MLSSGLSWHSGLCTETVYSQVYLRSLEDAKLNHQHTKQNGWVEGEGEHTPYTRQHLD